MFTKICYLLGPSLEFSSQWTAETIGSYVAHADGFIVGMWLKQGGVASEPVDPARVTALLAQLA